MSDPTSTSESIPRRTGRGVLCGRCEHLNPLGLEACEDCHTPLFAPCPKCGHRNPRVLDHCENCERVPAVAAPAKWSDRPSGRGVLCVKCDHLNPLGIEACEECQASLFAPCPKCGHRNPRVLGHCEQCERAPAAAPNDDNRPRGQGVLCVKCEHLNPLGLEACETCRAPLFAPCPRCGHQNPRVFDRCEKCERSGRVPTQAEAPAGPKGQGVLCVKCEHLNPLGLDKCETCDAHLFVFCSRCGHQNARVHSRCEKCQRKLHRTVRQRWKEGDEPRPVNLLYFGFTLVALLALAAAIVWFSGIHLPRLW